MSALPEASMMSQSASSTLSVSIMPHPEHPAGASGPYDATSSSMMSPPFDGPMPVSIDPSLREKLQRGMSTGEEQPPDAHPNMLRAVSAPDPAISPLQKAAGQPAGIGVAASQGSFARKPPLPPGALANAPGVLSPSASGSFNFPVTKPPKSPQLASQQQKMQQAGASSPVALPVLANPPPLSLTVTSTSSLSALQRPSPAGKAAAPSPARAGAAGAASTGKK